MVIEGLMPFVAPSRWREMMAKLSQARDIHVRVFASVSMLCGLLLLWCMH
ncbi:DUF2065 family protein [Xylophilus sp. Kf1]|nr:DUF2065 family protein [Xylophilus sp. Kf1]